MRTITKLKKYVFNHINDCWNAIEECKTHQELLELLENFPIWSGTWIVVNNQGYCQVINEFYEKNTEDYDFTREDTDIPYEEEEEEEQYEKSNKI